MAASSGLPLSAVTGVRFALQPGTGRTAVPVRTAIVGAVLAVLVLTATVTFSASLDSLVSHPALYGWNWSYAIESTNGEGSTLPETQTLLDHDPDVEASSGVDFRTAEIDGQTVAALQGTANASVGPPVLSGHAVDGSGQAVLGEDTLAQLHKKIGDTVHVVTEGGHANFVIVGTTTLPAVGISQGLHTSMGTGAYAALGSLSNNAPAACDGPTMIFVRLRRGVSARIGRASLQRIAARSNRTFDAFGATNPCAGQFVSVVGAQRPAEIVNYQSIGDTPALLAAGTGGRGGSGAGPDPDGLGATAAPGSGAVQDTGLLRAPAHVRRGLAVDDFGGDRHPRRSAPRHHRRALPLEPVRPGHLRRPRPECAGRRHRPDRDRLSRLGQRGRRDSGTNSGTDAYSVALTGRVSLTRGSLPYASVSVAASER